MKRVSKLFSINASLLALYLDFIWGSYIYTYVTDDRHTFGILFILIVLVSHFISLMVIRLVGKLRLSSHITIITTKKKWILWGVFTLIAFAYAMLFWTAYYPGSFVGDNYSQYSQAIYDYLDNWHPAWDTFLFYRIPVLLGASYAGIVFAHLLYFSVIMGCLGYYLFKYTNLKLTIFALAYIYLNPYVGYCIIYPYKDVTFALTGAFAIALATGYIFENNNNESKWISWGKPMAIGFLLANASIFRHNGILLTFFIAVGLFFFMSKKTWIRMVLMFLVSFVLIKGPIYKLLKVDMRVPYRVVETCGLPMSIICSVAQNAPEKLDAKTMEFVNSVAPQSEWANYYELGNFNTFKWTYSNVMNVCEEYGRPAVIEMSLRCFAESPKYALKGLFATTDVVYGVNVGVKNDLVHTIGPDAESGYDVPQPVYAGNEQLASIIEAYKEFLKSTILNHFRTIGFALLICLIILLSNAKLNTINGWKKIMMCLPIFAYDFGTMLFLSGPDSRFFVITYFIAPFVCIIGASDKDE